MSKTKDAPKFEDALAELESIVRELEDGQIDLDESLSRYEKGVTLLRHCYAQLRQAEKRILKLTGQSEDGEPILKPFSHTATADGGNEKPEHLPLWADETD